MSEALYERLGRILKDPNALPLLTREIAEVRSILRNYDKIKLALQRWVVWEDNQILSQGPYVGKEINALIANAKEALNG